MRRLGHEVLPGDALSGFRRAKRPVHVGAAVMLAIMRPGAAASGSRLGAAGFSVLRPNTGIRRGCIGNGSVTAISCSGKTLTIILMGAHIPSPGVGMDMDAMDLEAKYDPISPEEAEAEWTDAYSRAFHHCIHGPECRLGADCSVRDRMDFWTWAHQYDLVLL